MKSKHEEWKHPGAGYIPSLDGLRAVSVALVFAAHATGLDFLPGGFGVTVFFFLSGFLITTLLVREFESAEQIDFTAFYIRRLFRLMPPLLLTLFLAIVLCRAGLVPGHLEPDVIASQIFFAYNYYSLVPDVGNSVRGLGVLWSLSVEEHFYFVWPLIFLGVARQKVSVFQVVILVSLILLWRFWRVLVWGDGEWEIYISTDTRFDSMLFGCLLAILMWRNMLPGWVRTPLAMYASLLVALGLLLLTFLWRDPVFRSTLRYTFQGLALMPVFFYAVSRPDIWLFRFLNINAVKRIGVYSYTLYLVHYVIIHMIWEVGIDRDNTIVVIMIAASLSLLWAHLVHQYVELPLISLRRRFGVARAQ